MVNHHLIEINDTTWETLVEKATKPVIIMFYSPTCPYCAQIKPYFEKYSSEFHEKVLFARIDIAQNPLTAGRYAIMGVPTFKFFCHGKSVSELTGSVYPPLLKKTIEDGLKYGKDCEKNTTWIDSSITGYQ